MDFAEVKHQSLFPIKIHTIPFKLSIAVLVVIALLAFGVRLLTFDRYLPMLDYVDESNMYLLARDWRGVEQVPVIPEWLAGYPPLYIWVNIVVQQTVEAHWNFPWIFPSVYFYYARLLAAVIGGITTLVIMRLGWQLGGGIAAAFAGSAWALSPFVVNYNSLAIPDPLVYLCAAVALVTAFEAWKSKSPFWLLGSLLAGIAATYLKYPAAFLLIPWGIVTLTFVYRWPRRWWYWLVTYLGIGAVAAAYLLLGYGALSLSNREATTVRSDGLRDIFSLSYQTNNWHYAIIPMGTAFFSVAAIAGVAAYIISRRRGWRILQWLPIAVILLCGLVGISITTTYTYIGLPAGKIRHSLPVTVGLVGVWGAAISQVYWTLRAWWTSKPHRVSWLPQAAIIGFALPVGLWLAQGSISSIQTFALTPTMYIAQQYADSSLPADGLFLMYPKSAEEGIFNRPWSGYSGSTSFDWWLEDPTGSTPAELARRGMTYFILSSSDWRRVTDETGLRQLLQQMTPLGTIHAGDGQFGPDITFYRILPPQTTLNVTFGQQIDLVGYDLSSTEGTPGQILTFRPYWCAQKTPDANYSMFIHIYPRGTTTLITQFDGNPALPKRLTLTWNDPSELVIGTDAQLTIPADTPPGDYTLAVGLYDPATGQRLMTDDGGDKIMIPIRIVSQPSS